MRGEQLDHPLRLEQPVLSSVSAMADVWGRKVCRLTSIAASGCNADPCLVTCGLPLVQVIASFEDDKGLYNQADAGGFIKLQVGVLVRGVCSA
jgi:hypothetical protein